VKRRVHRDANHAPIVRALEGIGCTVLDLSSVGGGCPDVAVGRGGVTYLLEIKRPLGPRGGSHEHQTLKPHQAEWHARWRGGPVCVVRSVDEALRAVGVTASASSA
jgi:hypothetical protein